MKNKTSFDSPALKSKSEFYPPSWQGRVPLRVRMYTTISSDFPGKLMEGEPLLIAVASREYEVYVEEIGTIAVIFPEGLLWLHPYEFEVTAWYEDKIESLNT